MSELGKSGVFGGVALVSAVLAFAFQGSSGKDVLPELVGKPLCPEFTDALAANSLTITRFDESVGRLSEIDIKAVDGIWTIPSHDGYPADAENKIRDATTPFIDLNIIRVASESDSDHPLYGVVEPNSQTSEVTDEGVGTLVEVRDNGGKSLASVIIGKEVKDQEGQRFVRLKGKSQVFVCEIDPSNLPVKFEEWIEKDLLDVGSFDIENLTLKDYSFDVIPRGLSEPITSYNQRLEVALSYKDNKWNLDKLRENLNGQFVESSLLETEEIDAERINGLRTALAELEIVNVEKKPAGLTAGLKADNSFFDDRDGVTSLIERGFYPVELDGHAEMLSSEGEIIATTKDGIEYVLRFGGMQGLESEADASSINRYLLVSARVNEQRIPAPELEPLPELPGGSVDPPTSVESDDEESENLDSSCAPQDEEETEVVEIDADPVDATSPDDAGNDDAGNDDNNDAAADETGDADVGDVNGPSAPDADSGSISEESAENDSTPANDGDAIAEARAAREKIQKENQRKVDEHEEKLKTAREKVRDLNYRFADWYYVISEDVYKKIHLSRSDIVKESDAAKEAGFSMEAFDKIREDGKELLKTDQ